MDVSWLHDIVPSKIKSNLNCRFQLTCDDWGIPNTKLKYCQCTSAALLCCENTQLCNCIWQIITHVWWLWLVLCISRCYKTSSSFWWLILSIWDFGRSHDQMGSGSSGIHREFAKFSVTLVGLNLFKEEKKNTFHPKLMWKTRITLSYIMDIVAADDPAKQGAHGINSHGIDLFRLESFYFRYQKG